MSHSGNLMYASCLVPTETSPALIPGEEKALRALLYRCFQVWLWLSVMSACLIGTQPSSGARDKMGALPQAGTGLGEGQGIRPCCQRLAGNPRGICTFFFLGASGLWQGMGPLKLVAEVHSTPQGRRRRNECQSGMESLSTPGHGTFHSTVAPCLQTHVPQHQCTKGSEVLNLQASPNRSCGQPIPLSTAPLPQPPAFCPTLQPPPSSLLSTSAPPQVFPLPLPQRWFSSLAFRMCQMFLIFQIISDMQILLCQLLWPLFLLGTLLPWHCPVSSDSYLSAVTPCSGFSSSS